MNKALPTGQTLEHVRDGIDALDDRMLQILAERFELVEQVKALKFAHDAPVPLRPAREAQVLRRLIKKARATGLDPELLVRVWPAIFCAASLRQGPVGIHLGPELGQSIAARLVVRDYYPLAPVAEHADDAAAFAAAEANPASVAIAATDSNWLPHLRNSKTKVTGTLPFLAAEAKPAYLVIGHAAPQATGDDVTLVATAGGLPRDFAVKAQWQVTQGDRTVSALPGFLSEKEPPLHALIRSNARLALRVIGRYPAPVRISS